MGVSLRGTPVLARAYGMADLEHDVPNTPDTIFEAGSVSKQFTAAAVLLLARDGKLSLDDPVRKYIPELPDYGRPLTIRHLLTHTSGLRDWGNVASIGGWPRTSRVYTHAHVLEIVSRQRALNFPPGEHYSYSNTGYNLAAMIVSRVSGMPFADFTRTRIFEPMGMTRTSWRDDYGRIVKGRAMSYAVEGNGFRTLMPFENVYGNGGLLTTVGDLLKWNENYVAPRVGDAAMLAEQQRPRPLTNGRMQSLCAGPDGRHVQGRARGRSQRIDRGLSCPPGALSGCGRFGGGAVQCEQRGRDDIPVLRRRSVSGGSPPADRCSKRLTSLTGAGDGRAGRFVSRRADGRTDGDRAHRHRPANRRGSARCSRRLRPGS